MVINRKLNPFNIHKIVLNKMTNPAGAILCQYHSMEIHTQQNNPKFKTRATNNAPNHHSMSTSPQVLKANPSKSHHYLFLVECAAGHSL